MILTGNGRDILLFLALMTISFSIIRPIKYSFRDDHPKLVSIRVAEDGLIRGWHDCVDDNAKLETSNNLYPTS